jgi:hypothetical protein
MEPPCFVAIRALSAAAVWRVRIYEARNLGTIRLERHWLAKVDAVRESYGAMAEVLAGLT